MLVLRVEAARETRGEIWVLAKAEALLQKQKKPSCWRSSAHQNASRISGMPAISICGSNYNAAIGRGVLLRRRICIGSYGYRVRGKKPQDPGTKNRNQGHPPGSTH